MADEQARVDGLNKRLQDWKPTGDMAVDYPFYMITVWNRCAHQLKRIADHLESQANTGGTA